MREIWERMSYRELNSCKSRGILITPMMANGMGNNMKSNWTMGLCEGLSGLCNAGGNNQYRLKKSSFTRFCY